MKKKIAIGFRHFWNGFNPEDNLFTRLLREMFDVEICENPRFLFFSTFNNGSTTSVPEVSDRYIRIFYTAENCRPQMDKCEWAFSFNYDETICDKRHQRLPFYTYWGAGANLVKPDGYAASVAGEKRLFCNFVYSKDAEPRVTFFKKLSRYKKVDAPGRSMNTMEPIIENSLARRFARLERGITGRSILGSLYSRHYTRINESKIAFLKRYKFTIAFENSSFPGYTTEKIYHPMLSGSIPVYWGDPLVHRDFNSRSFINCHEYSGDDAVIERIIAIDRDDALYREYLDQPWLHGNTPNPCMDLMNLKNRLREIFG